MRCRTVLRLLGGVMYEFTERLNASELLKNFLRNTGWRFRFKAFMSETGKLL